jgi:hypothetical protein
MMISRIVGLHRPRIVWGTRIGIQRVPPKRFSIGFANRILIPVPIGGNYLLS